MLLYKYFERIEYYIKDIVIDCSSDVIEQTLKVIKYTTL